MKALYEIKIYKKKTRTIHRKRDDKIESFIYSTPAVLMKRRCGNRVGVCVCAFARAFVLHGFGFSQNVKNSFDKK